MIGMIQEGAEDAVSLEEFKAASKKRLFDFGNQKGNGNSKLVEKVETFQGLRYGALFLVNNILLRGLRMVVPEELQDKIISLAHEGHLGISKMKERLRPRFYFPGMDKKVEQKVKECRECVMMSLPNAPDPIKPTLLPSRVWDYLGLDLFGPLLSGEHILGVIEKMYHPSPG